MKKRISEKRRTRLVRDAAPDMLRALKRLVKHKEFRPCPCGKPPCLTLAIRKAIAKAEGREQSPKTA